MWLRQCSWQRDSELNTLLHVIQVNSFSAGRVVHSSALCCTACDTYIPLTSGAMSTARQLSNSSRSFSLWNTGILLPADNASADAQPAVCSGLLQVGGDDNSGSETSLQSLTSFSWSADVIVLAKFIETMLQSNQHCYKHILLLQLFLFNSHLPHESVSAGWTSFLTPKDQCKITEGNIKN